MELSPFPYHGPLLATEVRGRDGLVTDLVERVTARRVTALLGPRRFGKTSVLRRVQAELSEMTTVWVDLYEVRSLADVAVRFDEGIAGTKGWFSATAKSLATAASLNLGAVRVEMTRPAASRPDPTMTLKGLLDVLVETALRSPTLLVVDEFSAIAAADGAAGLLRTVLQHHYRDLGILFAGSHPSMMRTLFSERPQPFYSQADLVEIGRLDLAALHEIVTAGFRSTGREAGGVPAMVAEFGNGHPQRSMQLADAIWRRTPQQCEAGAEQFAEGLNELRMTTDEGMERLFSVYGAGERAVLRSVARSGSVYGAGAQLLDLSAGSAAHASRQLLDDGDLSKGTTGLRVVDPLFADWLRRRFPI